MKNAMARNVILSKSKNIFSFENVFSVFLKQKIRSQPKYIFRILIFKKQFSKTKNKK